MTQEVPLTKGYTAIIDDKDADLILCTKWHALVRVDTVYAQSRRRGMLHRVIMNPPDGMDVDHADGNGLNNTRANLRICTRSENMANQRVRRGSQYRGVSRKRDKYRARLTVDGVEVNLGTFDTPEEAAIAYDSYITMMFGEYAKTNF